MTNIVFKRARGIIILLVLPIILTMVVSMFAIEGASYVVDTVTSFFSNIGGGTGLFKQDVNVWADSLGDKEIEELMKSGVGIHPRKFGKYIELENSSIPKNATTKRKMWTVNYNKKVNAWPDTSSTPTLHDHTLDLYNKAEPYRLFYESLLAIDFINNTAVNENDFSILDQAKKSVDDNGISSVFDWSFDFTEQIKNNSLYYNIDQNSFSYEETRYHSYYTETRVFKDGRLDSTSEEQSDYRYSYPLPYLNSVKTMFKDYEFTYEKVVLEEEDWKQVGKPITKSWTTEEFSHTEYTYDKAGKVIDSEDIYETIYWTSVTTNEERKKIEKDVPLPFSASDNPYFFEFLKANNIDYKTDSALIYEIVSKLPDSMDFTMPLRELLDIEFINIDYGNLDLDFNIDTSDSSWLSDIPYIYQTDSRWKNLPYGRESTIGASGCGPTSVAIVIQAYRNAGYNLKISDMDLDRDGIVNPYEAGVWSVKKGFRAYGAGTYWSYIAGAGNEVGLKVTQVGKTAAGGQQVLNALSEGKLVIASMSRGTFTRGGHFIVLAGLDSNGKIIVRDSNSSTRSYTTYNFASPVFSEANAFWILSP